ncbi:hypothetical protein Oscil6304_1467 [Oscillatoria acuminata PCC 6304]|uniref:Uncharacterized protein n=1 Tax=Oscillatoria acuminata PCC 6304 TaxID=56110 RepID=K9TE63_9CYAN|nr:hypothetical protein Oscil6304_1467 [Oscillatoria acuminata PCC 6304]
MIYLLEYPKRLYVAGCQPLSKRKRDRHVTADTLYPLILPDVAQATSGGPHPNPDLAKGRGPEAYLSVKTLPL